MRLKWGDKEKIYLTKKPKQEKNDDAIIWFILALVSLCGIGYFIWMVLR